MMKMTQNILVNNSISLNLQSLLFFIMVVIGMSINVSATPSHTISLNLKNGVFEINDSNPITTDASIALEVRGGAPLNMMIDQGASNSVDYGIEGTVRLVEEDTMLLIGNANALGNGLKKHNATLIYSPDNYLAMADQTSLKFLSNVDGLNIPIKADNALNSHADMMFSIDCNNNNLYLKLEGAESNGSGMIETHLVNTANSPVATEVVLMSSYTQGSTRDKLSITSTMTLTVSDENCLPPRVFLPEGSTLLIQDLII